MEISNEIIDYVFKTYIQPMDKNSEGEQCSNYDWNDANDLIVDIAEKLQPKTFEDACKPLIKWLCENQHPHTHVILTSNRAELVEGLQCYTTDEFIVD